MEIVEIGKDHGDLILLQNFIDNLGSAKSTFRYFNKRNAEVVGGHLTTLLGLEKGKPIGYGHLDPENGIVWLGICILPDYQRFGHGYDMMTALLNRANFLGLKEIFLAVDTSNLPAQIFYRKFRFFEVESNLKYKKFKLILGRNE